LAGIGPEVAAREVKVETSVRDEDDERRGLYGCQMAERAKLRIRARAVVEDGAPALLTVGDRTLTLKRANSNHP